MIAHKNQRSMARTVKKTLKAVGGRPQVYPWQDWFNGQVWQLYKGTTYKSSNRTMIKTIRAAASRLGYTVSIKENEKGLVVGPRVKPNPATAKVLATTT